MPNMNPAELTDFVKQIFIGAGAEPATAELVARSLVLSDMAGHESHGTVRVRQYLDQIGRGDINPTAKPEIVDGQRRRVQCGRQQQLRPVVGQLHHL